ncbi:MAG: PIN domain-containing protein, partial [Methanomicrobiales archaeon]
MEYWKGNNQQIRNAVDGPGDTLTPVISIAEIKRKYGDYAGSTDSMIREIRQKSRIITLDATLARKAGAIRRVMKEGGLGDAVIYATAQTHKGDVLTRDSHFRDFSGVV